MKGRALAQTLLKKNKKFRLMKNKIAICKDGIPIIRLIAFGLIAANTGYTLFLMPVLGIICPEKVPFSIANIVSFVMVNSMAGIKVCMITKGNSIVSSIERK
jgi:hypothetical protein